MSLMVENSTVDTGQLGLVQPRFEKQNEFCRLILLYEQSSVTPSLAIIRRLRNYLALTDWETLSRVEAGSAATITYPSTAIGPVSREWVCSFFQASAEPFELTEIFTQAYDESAGTYPHYAPETPSLGDLAKRAVRDLFDTLDFENPDTDIAYDLTNSLTILIRGKGKAVVSIIGELISKGELNDIATYEALKAIGRIADDNSKYVRFDLLVTSLRSDSPIARDGAALGLSFMDDSRAIPGLRALLERETLPILKENIRAAIKDIESA